MAASCSIVVAFDWEQRLIAETHESQNEALQSPRIVNNCSALHEDKSKTCTDIHLHLFQAILPNAAETQKNNLSDPNNLFIHRVNGKDLKYFQ